MEPNASESAPVVIIIRDGWGTNPHPEHDAFNAVKLAATPVADALAATWPSTLVRTCGEDVGLSEGTMGNSEVGHQNIGAGRIVDQEIMRITRAIRSGGFFENEALLEAFAHARTTGGAVHLLGLVSDGRVHSDIEHLFALLDLAARIGWPPDRLFVHAITDGRDTGPTTGIGYMESLEAKLAATGVGRIASVIGRYTAMDRDNRWSRIATAYDCLVSGTGAQAPSAAEALLAHYDNPSDERHHGDEFVPPTVIGDGAGRVRSGDSVIFFNYRGDRPRELTRAFIHDEDALRAEPNGGFERGPRLDNLYFCTMARYEQGLPVTAVAFDKPPKMPNILGQIIADAGLTQFRCAETEKYAHVTFFFNDYREPPFTGEDRVIVPSPTDVGTYDEKPEMSAAGVRDAVLARLEADDTEALIVVNFANGDMVGHTGKLEAATRAIECVDGCVGRIVEATLACGGSLIITADHGNAEQMWNPALDCPHTAHTVYDVPLIVVGQRWQDTTLREGGRLADIAPTALAMLGIEQPAEMTGESLVCMSRQPT